MFHAYLADSDGTRIPDAEAFGSLSTEEGLAGGGSVQTHVAHNDVVHGFELSGHVLGRVDHHLTPRQTLNTTQINQLSSSSFFFLLFFLGQGSC